jgi:hypothetical protein
VQALHQRAPYAAGSVVRADGDAQARDGEAGVPATEEPVADDVVAVEGDEIDVRTALVAHRTGGRVVEPMRMELRLVTGGDQLAEKAAQPICELRLGLPEFQRHHVSLARYRLHVDEQSRIERARAPRSIRDIPRWAHLRAHEWAPVLRPRSVIRSAAALAASRRGERSYRILDEGAILATRNSDTVFVFGTGRSLLDVADDEWARIGAFQTIALSEFHRHRFVRVDYHLVNEVHDPVGYGASIQANPFYADTTFIVQEGWLAHRANDVIGGHHLPGGARVFRYKRSGRARDRLPSTSFRSGLAHGWNSSFDAVNFALLMGWRKIVLAGIDMYDRQYSYLPAGETHHGQGETPPESTPFRGVEKTVPLYARWHAAAAEHGAELTVYNSVSALAAVLPVFHWDN